MPRNPDNHAPALTAADQKRFWANVDLLGDHWWWVGSYDGKYPRMRLESGAWAPVGFVAYQITGNPVPAGRRVRYLCLKGQCVNPEHLGTYSKKAGPWTHTKRPGTTGGGQPPLTPAEVRSLHPRTRRPGD